MKKIKLNLKFWEKYYWTIININIKIINNLLFWKKILFIF